MLEVKSGEAGKRSHAQRLALAKREHGEHGEAPPFDWKHSVWPLFRQGIVTR